jgi:RNA polymerase sigma factor (sigma-70 family)
VSFRELPDHELSRLEDDALVAYGRAAREAGEQRAARIALAILIWGLEDLVHSRLALRLPPHAVDEVTRDVLVRAVGAAFDGQSVGEFRSWMNTIIARAVADYYRVRERRVQETALPEEHDDGEVWGASSGAADETGAVELRMVVDALIAELPSAHGEVIDLYVFQGFTAAEACERIPSMSEANVHQIASRFRAALRERLEVRP